MLRIHPPRRPSLPDKHPIDEGRQYDIHGELAVNIATRTGGLALPGLCFGE
jgi:hypothetical protein